MANVMIRIAKRNPDSFDGPSSRRQCLKKLQNLADVASIARCRAEVLEAGFAAGA